MKHTGAFYEHVYVCLRVYTCIYAIDFCHGLIYLAAAIEYQIHSMTLTTKFIAFDGIGVKHLRLLLYAHVQCKFTQYTC